MNIQESKEYLQKIKRALYGYMPDTILIINHTALSEQDCAKAIPPNQNWEYISTPTTMSDLDLVTQDFAKDLLSCVVFINEVEPSPSCKYRALFPHSRLITLNISNGSLCIH